MSKMQALYEELYANHGYHADVRLSHTIKMVDRLIAPLAYAFRQPILDVGCSHGRAVERLWSLNITAIGVDIAPTAVEMARRHRSHGRLCGAYPCFQVASATSLPFPNKSMDAILSSDVLEHLLPDQVNEMAAEFTRVARKLLVMKVATSREVNTEPIKALSNSALFSNVTQLHTTVWSPSKWASVFEKHGSAWSFTDANHLLIFLR